MAPVDSSPVTTIGAFATGIATVTNGGSNDPGVVLDVWYPEPELGTHSTSDTRVLSGDETPSELTALVGADAVRGVKTVAVQTTIADLGEPPVDAYDVYLRLHLISHRLVKPHAANLDGIFGLLANVVWTNHGPCPVEGFEKVRGRLRSRGHVTVYSIDKFPRMVDYVAPGGVRIGDADRVRLGAHLAAGTTVMHEGFVNYNAGTLGSSMIEGRVSAGVVVGDGSDIGGGASTMGTLSGGGKEVISLGKRCLLGANSGCGIALGDDCVIEAGLYVTAGTKVTGPDGSAVKARELSGQSNLLFRRNSMTGAIEVRPWKGDGIALNAALHKND